MPKGKTNNALTFVIPPELFEAALFKGLQEQGHTLTPMPRECINADVIFGINCHILTEEMMNQKGIMDMALKAARKRKKEKK